MILIYGAFADYWNLGHKVTFDGTNRLIIINPGVTTIDVQRDIYSSWKEWMLVDLNVKYFQALRLIGGEPTVDGQFLDSTYFLINGWRIKPQPGSYSLKITGNLFDVDGGDIFVPAEVVTGIPNNININTNTAVVVRKIEGGGITVDNDEVLNKLVEFDQTYFRIENRIIQIEQMFQQPIIAQLEPTQENALYDIQQKIMELWQLHGLDANNSVLVNKDKRVVASIEQTFTPAGNDIIVTRE